MLFVAQFLRRHGGSGNIPTIGSDSDPTTPYGTNGVRPAEVPFGWNYSQPIPAGQNDNLLVMRMWNKDQIPERRIAVAWLGPVGATTQTANFYAWEELTQHWFLINASPVTLTPGQLSFLDAPIVAEATPATQQIGGTGLNFKPTQGQPGDLIVMCNLLVDNQATAGTYQVAMAPSLANSKNP